MLWCFHVEYDSVGKAFGELKLALEFYNKFPRTSLYYVTWTPCTVERRELLETKVRYWEDYMP